MWDEADRRAPIPSRERDDRRDDRDSARGGRDRDRNRDRGTRDADRERYRGTRDADRERDRGTRDADRERDRRYRSRSPRERGGRDMDRGGRHDDRDAREKDRSGRGKEGEWNGERGGRGDRGEYGAGSRAVCFRIRTDSNDVQGSGRDTRDREQERSRSKDRRRSRSPRRERDGERHMLKPAEEKFTKSRTATPPVSFKVGRAVSHEAQDHDRMDTDEDVKQPKAKGGPKGKKVRTSEPEDDDDIVIEDDGIAAMQAMMGFGGFGTTQYKQVAGNNISAVRKEKKSEYRQYMNRVGGFNRPLSPSHE
jgi:U4/U6.U5 tri-snRNP-associated protein 3